MDAKPADLETLTPLQKMQSEGALPPSDLFSPTPFPTSGMTPTSIAQQQVEQEKQNKLVAEAKKTLAGYNAEVAKLEALNTEAQAKYTAYLTLLEKYKNVDGTYDISKISTLDLKDTEFAKAVQVLFPEQNVEQFAKYKDLLEPYKTSTGAYDITKISPNDLKVNDNLRVALKALMPDVNVEDYVTKIALLSKYKNTDGTYDITKITSEELKSIELQDAIKSVLSTDVLTQIENRNTYIATLKPFQKADGSYDVSLITAVDLEKTEVATALNALFTPETVSSISNTIKYQKALNSYRKPDGTYNFANLTKDDLQNTSIAEALNALFPNQNIQQYVIWKDALKQFQNISGEYDLSKVTTTDLANPDIKAALSGMFPTVNVEKFITSNNLLSKYKTPEGNYDLSKITPSNLKDQSVRDAIDFLFPGQLATLDELSLLYKYRTSSGNYSIGKITASDLRNDAIVQAIANVLGQDVLDTVRASIASSADFNQYFYKYQTTDTIDGQTAYDIRPISVSADDIKNPEFRDAVMKYFPNSDLAREISYAYMDGTGREEVVRSFWANPSSSWVPVYNSNGSLVGYEYDPHKGMVGLLYNAAYVHGILNPEDYLTFMNFLNDANARGEVPQSKPLPDEAFSEIVARLNRENRLASGRTLATGEVVPEVWYQSLTPEEQKLVFEKGSKVLPSYRVPDVMPITGDLTQVTKTLDSGEVVNLEWYVTLNADQQSVISKLGVEAGITEINRRVEEQRANYEKYATVLQDYKRINPDTGKEYYDIQSITKSTYDSNPDLQAAISSVFPSVDPDSIGKKVMERETYNYWMEAQRKILDATGGGVKDKVGLYMAFGNEDFKREFGVNANEWNPNDYFPVEGIEYHDYFKKVADFQVGGLSYDEAIRQMSHYYPYLSAEQYALLDPVQLVQQGVVVRLTTPEQIKAMAGIDPSKPVYELSAKELAKMWAVGGQYFLPAVGTIAFWSQMDNTGKAISIISDLLFFATLGDGGSPTKIIASLAKYIPATEANKIAKTIGGLADAIKTGKQANVIRAADIMEAKATELASNGVKGTEAMTALANRAKSIATAWGDDITTIRFMTPDEKELAQAIKTLDIKVGWSNPIRGIELVKPIDITGIKGPLKTTAPFIQKPEFGIKIVQRVPSGSGQMAEIVGKARPTVEFKNPVVFTGKKLGVQSPLEITEIISKETKLGIPPGVMLDAKGNPMRFPNGEYVIDPRTPISAAETRLPSNKVVGILHETENGNKAVDVIGSRESYRWAGTEVLTGSEIAEQFTDDFYRQVGRELGYSNVELDEIIRGNRQDIMSQIRTKAYYNIAGKELGLTEKEVGEALYGKPTLSGTKWTPVEEKNLKLLKNSVRNNSKYKLLEETPLIEEPELGTAIVKRGPRDIPITAGDVQDKIAREGVIASLEDYGYDATIKAFPELRTLLKSQPFIDYMNYLKNTYTELEEGLNRPIVSTQKFQQLVHSEEQLKLEERFRIIRENMEDAVYEASKKELIMGKIPELDEDKLTKLVDDYLGITPDDYANLTVRQAETRAELYGHIRDMATYGEPKIDIPIFEKSQIRKFESDIMTYRNTQALTIAEKYLGRVIDVRSITGEEQELIRYIKKLIEDKIPEIQPRLLKGEFSQEILDTINEAKSIKVVDIVEEILGPISPSETLVGKLENIFGEITPTSVMVREEEVFPISSKTISKADYNTVKSPYKGIEIETTGSRGLQIGLPKGSRSVVFRGVDAKGDTVILGEITDNNIANTVDIIDGISNQSLKEAEMFKFVNNNPEIRNMFGGYIGEWDDLARLDILDQIFKPEHATMPIDSSMYENFLRETGLYRQIPKGESSYRYWPVEREQPWFMRPVEEPTAPKIVREAESGAYNLVTHQEQLPRAFESFLQTLTEPIADIGTLNNLSRSGISVLDDIIQVDPSLLTREQLLEVSQIQGVQYDASTKTIIIPKLSLEGGVTQVVTPTEVEKIIAVPKSGTVIGAEPNLSAVSPLISVGPSIMPITLPTPSPTPKPEPEPQPEPQPEIQPEPMPKPEPIPEPQPDPEPQPEPEPEPQPEPQPKPLPVPIPIPIPIPIPATIKTPRKVIIPIRLSPMEKFEQLTPKEMAGAVAWKQGFMYKLIYPPYGQTNIINSKTPFPGIRIHTGPRSAFETLAQITEGTLPPTISRDMGIMSIQIIKDPLTKKPNIRFTEKRGLVEASKAEHEEERIGQLTEMREY